MAADVGQEVIRRTFSSDDDERIRAVKAHNNVTVCDGTQFVIAIRSLGDTIGIGLVVMNATKGLPWDFECSLEKEIDLSTIIRGRLVDLMSFVEEDELLGHEDGSVHGCFRKLLACTLMDEGQIEFELRDDGELGVYFSFHEYEEMVVIPKKKLKKLIAVR